MEELNEVFKDHKIHMYRWPYIRTHARKHVRTHTRTHASTYAPVLLGVLSGARSSLDVLHLLLSVHEVQPQALRGPGG